MSDDMIRNLDDAPRSPECELVDARLADYLDDAPDPALVAEVDAHVAGCPRCAALVSDLTGISAAARALPPLRPTRDLWAGIAERIDAAPAVVPIETARQQQHERRVRALPTRWRTLAAAAALVFVTAGVTYTATKITMGERTITPVATTAAAPDTSIGGAVAPTPTQVAIADGQKPRPTSSADSSEMLNKPPRPGADRSTGAFQNVANDGRRPAAAPAATSAYDAEIGRLRKIVRERRSELDPATLAILDQNLKIIDDAIAQSRAALKRDPGSRFLDDQLNEALDKKVELLRMAALMPART